MSTPMEDDDDRRDKDKEEKLAKVMKLTSSLLDSDEGSQQVDGIITLLEKMTKESEQGVSDPSNEYKDLGTFNKDSRDHVRRRIHIPTGRETVAKLLPAQTSKTDKEVSALEDVQDGSGDFVKLHLVREEGKHTAVYMDIVPNGEELASHTLLRTLQRLRNLSSHKKLMHNFALCVLHNLLEILDKLHKQIHYAHGDVHGGNIIFMKDLLRLVLIDFGSAKRLNFPKGPKEHKAVEADLDCAVHVFCRLYFTKNFRDLESLQNELNEGRSPRLDEAKRQLASPEILGMSDKERDSMQQLLSLCQDMCDPNKEGYGKPETVLSCIEEMVYPGIIAETAYQCFLFKLNDLKLQHVVQKLEALPAANSPEAKLKESEQYLLRNLKQSEFLDIEVEMKQWGIFSEDGDEDGGEESISSEQVLQKLLEAVQSTKTPRFASSKIPEAVRTKMDERINNRLERIKRSAVMELFPDSFDNTGSVSTSSTAGTSEPHCVEEEIERGAKELSLHGARDLESDELQSKVEDSHHACSSISDDGAGESMEQDRNVQEAKMQ